VRYRIKHQTTYYRKQELVNQPTSQELLACFRDARACNVEMRKSRAAQTTVTISLYYSNPPAGEEALAFPKDNLGKLWDRIEENPVLSTLFHALMRRLGYHVELFFAEQEFEVFWRTHGSLPIRKLQLRYLRKDGFKHSPFGKQDCVSVDLFMLRRHQRTFEVYLKENFRAVQFNPGKHSA
jgi:hypothetical protein